MCASRSRCRQAEIIAREAITERAARANVLVVTLGPAADVELQPSGALETLAQQPGSEPASAPFPIDQEHRDVGLDDAVGLHLDRTDDSPVGDRHQRRCASRAQRTIGPRRVLRVFVPALRGNQGDQPIEVGACEELDRHVRHALWGDLAHFRTSARPFEPNTAGRWSHPPPPKRPPGASPPRSRSGRIAVRRRRRGPGQRG